MVCGVHLYERNQKKLLTLGAWISVLCLSVIFYFVYRCKIPLLRRHPINIIIRKSIFELLFVSQFLWMAFVPKSFFWTEVHDDDSPCETNPYIWPLSWLTQFSLLGGELWFWVLSVDIHIALTNPFSNTISNSYIYSGIVLGIAALTATILVTVVPIQYGLSSDPMIWIRDKRNTTNWMKFAMFYLFVPMIYLYCGAIAIWARWQINRGLEATLRNRKYSVRKQTTYVIGYMLFWTCVYTFQFVLYLRQEFGLSLSSDSEYAFQLVSGFLLSSRGMWSLATFLVANWPAINAYFRNEQQRLQFGENAPPKEEEEQVQLNIALQREIVNFTALGIQRSVRDMDFFQKRDTHSISSRYSSLNIFNIKMPGECVSFIVDDPSFSDSDGSVYPPRPSDLTSDDVDDHMTTNSPLIRPSLSLSPRNTVTFSRQRPSETSDNIMERTGQKDYVAYNIESNDSPYRSSKYGVDPSRNTLTAQLVDKIASTIIPTRNSFHFSDYSPLRFARIRQLSGVSPEQYITAFNSTTMPVFSEGRSGAFMYFSSNEQFIVKTTTEKEFEKLLTMLPDYEEYLATEKQNGHDSLLTRYLGAHRIVMYDIPLYFVVMLNVCPVVDEKYDLKGSWINRHGSKRVKDPAKARPKKYFHSSTGSFRHSLGGPNGDEKEPVPLFLDNDLKDSFLLSPDDANSLAQQLDRDSKFLRRFNLMDYSLLIGVKRRMYLVNPTSSSRANSRQHSSSFADFSVRTISGTKENSSLLSDSALEHNRRPSAILNTSKSALNASLPGDRKETMGSFSTLPLGSEIDSIGKRYDAAAVEGAGAFYFGIIDILQEWDWKKWNERNFKVFILQRDGNGLSAMEPEGYRIRFMQRAVFDVFSGLDMPNADDEAFPKISVDVDIEKQ